MRRSLPGPFSHVIAVFGSAALLLAGLSAPASAQPPHNPGGPCVQDPQHVSRASVAGYGDVVERLDQIEKSSQGAVTVHSAGRSGADRKLLYATVGSGSDVFWLQARIHGDELHSTEAALQILKHLTSGDPDARRIREQLTLVVVPMYNPDGAEANIRTSTTPERIDLNRDWEDFRQPESGQWYEVWEDLQPRYSLDLHHMGSAPVVEDTDDLNQFQIGARSISPSRMTDTQWRTNRQMAMTSVNALEQYGVANIARYPQIDITNAVLSRMLLGGPGPQGEDPEFQTQGAIFYEVRSVGQKSNGQLENLFRVPTMALLETVAQGDLTGTDISSFDDLPFAEHTECGGM